MSAGSGCPCRIDTLLCTFLRLTEECLPQTASPLKSIGEADPTRWGFVSAIPGYRDRRLPTSSRS